MAQNAAEDPSANPDFVYSAAFTYKFLSGIDTTGTHRPKSIHIPMSDLNIMTGMERQYWDIKKEYFDTVLFFKKGKFYELYDADAVIGNKEFGLKMTQDLNNRGKMRMSGVPEQSFTEWSRLFVFKGYKVGKVEQMVVDDKYIAANGGKEPKCIPRELTLILTRGTLTENNAISGPEPIYVLAIQPVAKNFNNNNSNNHTTNILPIDTVYFDCVAVDLSRQCYFHCPCETIAELVTLLHHLQPKEVLVPTSLQEEKQVADKNKNQNQNDDNNNTKKESTLTTLCQIIADLLPECHIEPILSKNAQEYAEKKSKSQSQSENENNNNNNKKHNKFILEIIDMAPPSWFIVWEYFKYLKIDAERLLPTDILIEENGCDIGDNEQQQQQGGGGEESGMLFNVVTNTKTPISSTTSENVRVKQEEGEEEQQQQQGTNFLRSYTLHRKNSSSSSVLTQDGDDDYDASQFLFSPSSASSSSGNLIKTMQSTKETKILNFERRYDPGMVLDSAAIECLDLVVNSRDGTSNSTILQWLLAERHSLPAASRILRMWLLRPSSSQEVITARQNAVKLIYQPPEQIQPLVDFWNSLLERNAAKAQQNIFESQSASSASASPGGGNNEDNEDNQGDDENQNQNQNKKPTTTAAKGRSSGGANAHPMLNEHISIATIDFERLLSRVSDFKSEDTRVSFVEPLLNYKKNMQNIHVILRGFELLLEFQKVAQTCISSYLSSTSSSSQNKNDEDVRLLSEIIDNINEVRTPVAEILKNKFPREKIRQANGLLLPQRGENKEYDEACDQIKNSEKQLEAKLQELQGKLKNKKLSFCDVGKDLFLLECPLDVAKPANLEKCGIQKGELEERARTQKNVKFQIKALQPAIAAYKKATTSRELAIVATLRGVASHMCKSWPQLFSAARAAAYLDCLFSLAHITNQQSCRGSVCFPEFTSVSSNSNSSSSSSEKNNNGNQSATTSTATSTSTPTPPEGSMTSLQLKEAYHPLLMLLRRKTIPNDFSLGDVNSPTTVAARFLVLTGPNAAGKSTAARTVAINCILAQIGGSVCAGEMKIAGAPVDRVFTRIGAKDATHRGQSTLFVELTETAVILREATGRSLCLLDELGRGTSTHDGYAIAHACLRDLAAVETKAEHLRIPRGRLPLCMFATHYHALAMEVNLMEGEARQRVQLGYMDFSAGRRRQRPSLLGGGSRSNGDEQNNQNQEQEQEEMQENKTTTDSQVQSDVEFLYKLVPGICARSYGAEVALQAGLPQSLVDEARGVSKKMALVSADHQLGDFRRFLLEKRSAVAAENGGANVNSSESQAQLLEKVRTRATQLIALAHAATASAE